MNKLNALSLLAVSSCCMLVLWGCNMQANEDGIDESELGEVEHLLTKCGSTCPSGSHPTQYSCNLFLCGSSCNGPAGSNQVTCEPNSGTFTQCGTTCPSGWNATQYSCNLHSCSYSCNGPGGSNGATCTPVCDPSAGTHGQIWISESANSEYAYHGGWCSIGTNWPAMCWEGTYYYLQSLASQFCLSVGSGGSCYDSNAVWSVTCDALVDCVYDCSGQCVPAAC
jgi:hypothetical protein